MKGWSKGTHGVVVVAVVVVTVVVVTVVVVVVLVVAVVVVVHTPHMNGHVRCTRSPWYWKAKQSARWNENRPHTSFSFTPKHSCGAYLKKQ